MLASETNVPDSPPRSAEDAAVCRDRVLLARPFDEGPLKWMAPQEGVTSTHDYLLALAQRPERVFGPAGGTNNLLGRATGWKGQPPLSDEDVRRLRDTWNRLGSLIPYHSGGFYIPGSLSPEARYSAYAVLQSKEYGVRHADMQMARFIVQWARPGDEHSDCTIALTGWEHAYRAPLWSCARMPPWLTPHLHPYERISWEEQYDIRAYIFRGLHTAAASDKRISEWIVAYVFGTTERWFEGLLSAHWGFRHTAEVALVRLKDHWMRERPDVPFPLEVGGRFLAGANLSVRGDRSHGVDGVREATAPWLNANDEQGQTLLMQNYARADALRHLTSGVGIPEPVLCPENRRNEVRADDLD